MTRDLFLEVVLRHRKERPSSCPALGSESGLYLLPVSQDRHREVVLLGYSSGTENGSVPLHHFLMGEKEVVHLRRLPPRSIPLQSDLAQSCPCPCPLFPSLLPRSHLRLPALLPIPHTFDGGFSASSVNERSRGLVAPWIGLPLLVELAGR